MAVGADGPFGPSEPGPRMARVEAPPAGHSDVLTPRELEVLSHIVAGRAKQRRDREGLL